MPLPIPANEPRSYEQLREQYEVERELAARLRGAGKSERRRLYGTVYDGFLARVPDQPMLRHKSDPAAQAHEVALKMKVLASHLAPDTTFLEVGAGDCSLAMEVCSRVRRVLVVEPAAELLHDIQAPVNLELLTGDEPLAKLADGGVGVAFTSHFIEHLHPDDALDHAKDMRRVVARGGCYLCVTPNRLWGPHDVSRFFDDAPSGLHLREYGYGELAALLRKAGFTQVRAVRGVRTEPREASLVPYLLAESALDRLSTLYRRRVLDTIAGSAQAPLRPLEQVIVVAR